MVLRGCKCNKRLLYKSVFCVVAHLNTEEFFVKSSLSQMCAGQIQVS